MFWTTCCIASTSCRYRLHVTGHVLQMRYPSRISVYTVDKGVLQKLSCVTVHHEQAALPQFWNNVSIVCIWSTVPLGGLTCVRPHLCDRMLQMGTAHRGTFSAEKLVPFHQVIGHRCAWLRGASEYLWLLEIFFHSVNSWSVALHCGTAICAYAHRCVRWIDEGSVGTEKTFPHATSYGCGG